MTLFRRLFALIFFLSLLPPLGVQAAFSFAQGHSIDPSCFSDTMIIGSGMSSGLGRVDIWAPAFIKKRTATSFDGPIYQFLTTYSLAQSEKLDMLFTDNFNRGSFTKQYLAIQNRREKPDHWNPEFFTAFQKKLTTATAIFALDALYWEPWHAKQNKTHCEDSLSALQHFISQVKERQQTLILGNLPVYNPQQLNTPQYPYYAMTNEQEKRVASTCAEAINETIQDNCHTAQKCFLVDIKTIANNIDSYDLRDRPYFQNQLLEQPFINQSEHSIYLNRTTDTYLAQQIGQLLDQAQLTCRN